MTLNCQMYLNVNAEWMHHCTLEENKRETEMEMFDMSSPTEYQIYVLVILGR